MGKQIHSITQYYINVDGIERIAKTRNP